MEIIYENCGVKNHMKEDHRSYRRNFCSCEKKDWKKKSGLYGIRTLAVWDTGAALLPIELTSQLGVGLWYRWPSRPAWKIGILRYQGHCIRMSFSSYLPNRSQIVPVGTIDSDADQILRGVSQSSFLGPLFFLIYVNDIHNVPVYLISTVLQTIPTFFFTRSKFTFPWVKIKRRIR